MALKIGYAILLMLYVFGSVLNGLTILSNPYGMNRDAMFSSHFEEVKIYVHLSGYILALLVFLGVSTTTPLLCKWRTSVSRISRWAYLPASCVTPLFVAVWAWLAIVAFRRFLPSPLSLYSAYYLRSLNLVLPILFSAVFLVRKSTCPACLSARTISLLFVLPALVLSSATSIRNAYGWYEARQKGTGSAKVLLG